MRIKPFLAKLRATYNYFRLYGAPIVDFYDEDLLKVALKEQLRIHHHPITTNDLILEEILDSAVKKARGLSSTSRIRSVSETEIAPVNVIVQKYCIVAAIAALWELNLKFFAGKADISVYRNNSTEHLETIELKKIVNKLRQKYPKIICNFDLYVNIRNSLTHGNLQQLKVILEHHLTKAQIDVLDPKMAVLFFNADPEKRVKLAAEGFSLEEAKEMGPFFWFLSQGNTRLLDYAADFLEKGLRELHALSWLHSLSFQETKGYFDQLAIHGRRWTKSQKQVFIRQCGDQISEDKSIVERELEYYSSLFKL